MTVLYCALNNGADRIQVRLQQDHLVHLGLCSYTWLAVPITQWRPQWRIFRTHSHCPISEADVILSEAYVKTTVPGLTPRDASSGNIQDIRAHGSLHEFLVDLHQKFGPIASFYFGPQLTISTYTPDLFKQQLKVFDKPPVLFALFEPLFGPRSITYINGLQGKARHAACRRCFSDVNVAKFFPTFQELSDDVIVIWEKLPDQEHINLRNHMFRFAIRVILRTVFGAYFEDNKRIEELRQSYDYCWGEMESQLAGKPLKEGSEEHQRFEKYKSIMYGMVLEAAAFHREHRDTSEYAVPLFVDIIDELNLDEDAAQSDMVTTLVAGFHTTGLLMTWAVFYLAANKQVQDRLHDEIREKWSGGQLTNDIVNSMTYVQQVIDETLRCSSLGPWAARVQDTDTELGGHVIPAGTPVIQALGVSLMNTDFYPNPEIFDPERFSTASKMSRPALAFEPFGFAGKRKCPGYKLSQAESRVLLVKLISKFEVKLVPDQEVSKVYGLVTSPANDIWVTVNPRN